MADIPPVLARREISSNRFLTFVEEDLRRADGGSYTYYQVESKWDAVVVVPVLPDGRLVLERVYRHPYRRFLVEFPAGGIEAGESPLDAARRELEEETGWRAGRVRALGSCEALPGLLRLRLHLVLAEDLVPAGPPRHDVMELIEIVEWTREQAWAEARREPVSSFLVYGLLHFDRELGPTA